MDHFVFETVLPGNHCHNKFAAALKLRRDERFVFILFQMQQKAPHFSFNGMVLLLKSFGVLSHQLSSFPSSRRGLWRMPVGICYVCLPPNTSGTSQKLKHSLDHCCRALSTYAGENVSEKTVYFRSFSLTPHVFSWLTTVSLRGVG